MAKVTSNKTLILNTPRPAKEFQDGDVLIHHRCGYVGVISDGYLVRESCDGDLWVNPVSKSMELFIKAPVGTSFTITAD